MADTKFPDQPRQDIVTAVPSYPTARSFKYRAVGIWIVGFSLLTGAAVWGYIAYRQPPAEAISVPLYTTERSTVELTVSSSGTLALGGQQTLKSPESEATVEQVLVEVRTQVEVGQPLVVLRNRSQEQEVRSQEVEIQKIQLDLERRQEKVTEVEQRVVAAIEQYQESQELLAQGFISEDDVRNDQEALDQVRSDLKDTELEVIKTELDLQTASERLLLLEQQLRDRIITAPINGIVLKIEATAGEAIETDTSLLTLGDPTREIVNLQLSTIDAAKISINQPTRVRAIGPDAQDYSGRVISLSPQALSDSSGGNSSEGQARVNARVLLDNASQTLIPGSFVSVEIITEQQQNVIVVPPEAVQRDGQQSFVWLRNQRGHAVQQPVVLGLQGLDLFEVTDGLNVGDQIALVPPTLTITPGTPINDPSELPPSDTADE